MTKRYKKIDDETLEVTTTPEPIIERIGREELQTELDHIPDRKAENQKQLDSIDKREVVLKAILKIFD